MKVWKILAMSLVSFGFAQVASADQTNVTMVNGTSAACDIEIFDGPDSKDVKGGRLNPGESGVATIEYCPSVFKASCGDEHYEDTYNCNDVDATVTFK